MKGRTEMSDKAMAPKSRKQPKDKLKGKMSGIGRAAMVAGAKRPVKLYGGSMVPGTKGTARGMGAAVKGGKFTDL